MFPTVFSGRYTVQLSEPVVVFLIGMRVNRGGGGGRWPWRCRGCSRAWAREPELGLLPVETFTRGRTVLLVQYWATHEQLERFATARDLPHAAPWARFTRELSGSGDVGIYHETYLVESGKVEAIYGDMPRFGLAAATSHVPITRGRETGRERIAAGASDPAARDAG